MYIYNKKELFNNEFNFAQTINMQKVNTNEHILLLHVGKKKQTGKETSAMRNEDK